MVAPENLPNFTYNVRYASLCVGSVPYHPLRRIDAANSWTGEDLVDIAGFGISPIINSAASDAVLAPALILKH